MDVGVRVDLILLWAEMPCENEKIVGDKEYGMGCGLQMKASTL